MRIVIIGAGALGGLVGAQLTQGGEDVTLIEINEARVKLLRESGLFVSEGTSGETCVPVRVTPTVEGLPVADLVFVSVKSYQTEGAVRASLPVIGPETFVLSMQNGIGNTDVMAEIIDPSRVLSGITYHSIQHTGPNRIRYRPGIKPIQIAPYDGVLTPEIERVGEVFRASGLNTEVCDRIDDVIWQKLLHNGVVNPVSAFLGEHLHELNKAQAFLFAQQVAGRHAHIVEEQFRGVLRVLADFFQVAAALKALDLIGLNHNEAGAFGAFLRVSFCYHDDEICVLAIGDKGFLAIDQVVVAVADCRCLYALEIAAGARFGHGDGADQFAGGHAGKPFLLLVFRAEGLDIGGDDIVVQAPAGSLDQGVRHFFREDRGVKEIAAGAAVLLGLAHAQQARFSRL
ncbi:2-dehydropantoate 2-reductase [bacterium]|nr:2-dehydropantoate 2-reductase [bacterium]